MKLSFGHHIRDGEMAEILQVDSRSYTINVYARRRIIVSFVFLIFTLPLFAADRPILVSFGDSITAGRGLSPDQAYPAFLQKKLDAAGYQYKVVNMGTSGATTKDAIALVPSVLRLHPAVVIVEFGGNDGLRGLPLEQTRSNLDQVITALENARIKVLVAGITLPPDYGSDYIHAFESIFPALATKDHTAIVPMIYKNLVNVPGTIQADGVHPTAKGSEIIASTLMPPLTRLLRKNSGH
jgi:acyl-CoA thioesterase I